jgi:serine/threonine protein phosphatase PrpC
MMPPMSVPKHARLWGGGVTHRGHVRDDNQDVIIVEPELGLYAVLDGMGGANAGDVAARMAAQAIHLSASRITWWRWCSRVRPPTTSRPL